jgi:general secretion pathway protein J
MKPPHVSWERRRLAGVSRAKNVGNSPARRRRSQGFTLIEVVIAAALMALILTSAYLCLNAGISSQKIIEPRAEIIQNARVAMAILTSDLRGACPLPGNSEFIGARREIDEMDADNLDFATHNYTPKHPREGDFCEESIFVDGDPETGQFSLWRRRNPTIAPDPLSGGSKEEIAKGIVGVRFEYSDGVDWYDSWGDTKPEKKETSRKVQPNLTGMPEAVRITLLLDSNPKSKKISDETGQRAIEPPFVFQTVARLNLAATVQQSSSGESSGQQAIPTGTGGTP